MKPILLEDFCKICHPPFDKEIERGRPNQAHTFNPDINLSNFNYFHLYYLYYLHLLSRRLTIIPLTYWAMSFKNYNSSWRSVAYMHISDSGQEWFKQKQKNKKHFKTEQQATSFWLFSMRQLLHIIPPDTSTVSIYDKCDCSFPVLLHLPRLLHLRDCGHTHTGVER